MSEERVERRLVAILAADVAGYSRLMGADEEGTLAALKAVRRELGDPKIREHRGRIVKTTGDGLLVEFASVVDAVRCAVELQHAMSERNAEVPPEKRIEFRMGINVGDVILDEGDIYGDGVNIAARLEALAEPGAVFVSRVVRDQVRDRIAVAFDDIGEERVKNIARPIRVFRVRLGAAGANHPLTPSDTVADATIFLPNKPAIAVLPFQSMSGDPEQEYFADGMVEDIITTLSHYPSLFIIGRNSSFTYKDRTIDVKQIGRELGVRYVLEGSVRKGGNRVRITTQLIEAESGTYVWAERYDRDISDVFLMQDEISEAVTGAIAPAVAHAERHRAVRKPPTSLDAWGASQRGFWHYGRASATENATAQTYFQRAIDLDPTFAGGYRGLALAQIQAAAVFQTRDVGEAQRSAEALAREAVALDANDPEAHACLSRALQMRGDHAGALAEAERALRICPNLAGAHGIIGQVLIFSGRARDGLEALKRYFRLDPRDSQAALRLRDVAMGLYFCGDYEASAHAAKEAILQYPDYPMLYRWLAAALGQTGQTAEAKKVLDRAISFAPAAFDMYVSSRPPWFRTEDHAHMIEGLRKAGWEG